MDPKIVVFVRCHALPTFVMDTIDSIRHYSVSNPTIVVTVDRNEKLAEQVVRERPGTLSYVCRKGAGWGAGMHRLFCEAARWLVESGIEFDFVMNMDYDLIFTRESADVHFLPKFDKPNIGMVGRVNRGASHWQRKTRQHLPKLLTALARSKKPFPMGYSPGAHTSGAFNILKSNCVLQMYHDGMLTPPLSDICDKVPIADDPLLSFWVACSGYKWNEMGTDNEAYIVWEMRENYRTIPARGSFLYHPTKLKPGNQPWSVKDELDCRNFFRKLRGQEPLSSEGLPKTEGPLNVTV